MEKKELQFLFVFMYSMNYNLRYQYLNIILREISWTPDKHSLLFFFFFFLFCFLVFF